MEHTYQGLVGSAWFSAQWLNKLFPGQDLRDRIGVGQNGKMRYAGGAYGMNVLSRLAPHGGHEAENYARKLANALGVE